jgi:hypothetical protein
MGRHPETKAYYFSIVKASRLGVSSLPSPAEYQVEKVKVNANVPEGQYDSSQAVYCLGMQKNGPVPEGRYEPKMQLCLPHRMESDVRSDLLTPSLTGRRSFPNGSQAVNCLATII